MASFQKYETDKGFKWSYTIELGKDLTTGKRTRKKGRGFKTKKEAQQAASAVEIQLVNGTFVNEKDITFKDFVKEWLDLYEKTVKPSTFNMRKPTVAKFLSLFANTKMKDITDLRYQEAINGMYEKGYSHNYLIGINAVGKLIFKKAIELKVIKNNPTEFAKIPKKMESVEELERKKKEVKYLEKEELARFLTVAKSLEHDYIYPFFSLLAYTGMRVGEQFALKWSDIDFDNNSISITKTIFMPGDSKHYQLQTPKTTGSVREIKIDPNVIRLLKQHQAKQSEIRLYQGGQYHNGNFIFASPEGYPVPRCSCRVMLVKILKMAEIAKPITLHSFRHTHTSLLIEADVGVKEIQQRLGHTDINTTMNIYAHMTKDLEEKASQKFSNLMEGLV